MITSTLLLGSPGPVPVALAATGATFGFKKGLSFLIGILCGISVAILVAAAGLNTLFTLWPSVKLAVQIIGISYLLFVAYKIASAPMVSNSEAANAPGFIDGFILNLLNPKAYAAFIAIFSQFQFTQLTPFKSSLVIALTCFCVAVVVDFLWLYFGTILKPVFQNPKYAKSVRVVFAGLLVTSLMFIVVSVVTSLANA